MFAEVAGEVVEFEVPGFVELDDLPIPGADGTVRGGAAGMVVRVMPEEGPLGEALALKERSDAEAIAVVSGGVLGAGDFEEGRVEVHRLDRGGNSGTGPGHAGPEGDEGNADAAFVDITLAGAEGEVAGGAVIAAQDETAVVGREEDDGIGGDAEGIQFGADAADGVVDRFEEGSVGGVALGVRSAGLVLGDDVGLTGERGVDGVVREVDEERVGSVLLDEGEGLRAFAVGEELAVGAVGELGEVVRSDVAGRLAAEIAGDVEVESELFRGGVLAEMPFADAGGGVAGGLETGSDGGFGRVQAFGPVRR